MMMTTLMLLLPLYTNLEATSPEPKSNRLGQHGQGGRWLVWGRLNLWPRLWGRLGQQRIAGAGAGAAGGAWCWCLVLVS